MSHQPSFRGSDPWGLDRLLARLRAERVELRIGVAEHLAAHQLARARAEWPPDQLADALASLLARDRDEWWAVHAIITRHLAELDAARQRERTANPPPRLLATPQRRLGLAALLGALAFALLLGPEITGDTPEPPAPASDAAPAPEPEPEPAPAPDPDPNPSQARLRVIEAPFEGQLLRDRALVDAGFSTTSTPDPNAPLDTSLLALLLSPLKALLARPSALLALIPALLGLALLSLTRRQITAHRESRRIDQEAREALDEGNAGAPILPYAVERHPFFDRRLLDDAATLLGRRHPAGEGTLLDVPRTLRAAIRNLGHITPIHRPRLRQPPLLVLLDLDEGGHPFLDGIHQILRRWRQSGLEFAAYSFCRRPARRLRPHPPDLDLDPLALAALAESVAADPRPGPDLDLERLRDRHPGARLLLFIDLRHAADDAADASAITVRFEWPARLAPWPSRALIDLDPTPPKDRPAAERARLPLVESSGLPRFPLTSRGLVAAAAHLVGRPPRGDDLEAVFPPKTPARDAALDLWAGAAAFVPDATWAQLEDLRRTFAPTIHELTGVDLDSPHCIELLVARLQHRATTSVRTSHGLELIASGLAPDLCAALVRTDKGLALAVLRRLRDQLGRALEDHGAGLSDKQRRLLALRRDFHDARLDPVKLREWLLENKNQGLDDFIADFIAEDLALARQRLALGDRPLPRALAADLAALTHSNPASAPLTLDLTPTGLRLGLRRLLALAPLAVGLVALTTWLATRLAPPPEPPQARPHTARYRLPAVYELVTEPSPIPTPARCPAGALDDPPTGGQGPSQDHTLDLGPGVAPIRFVFLTGGEFTMGSPDTEPGHQPDETRHRVCLTAFDIATTEVTVAHYRAVTGQTPSDCDYGCADTMPVQRVSWEEAVRFANALTARANRTLAGDAQLTPCYVESTGAWDRGCTGYRLPTEAEWEYAARAGSTGMWSFGEDEKELCKHGNVMDESGRSHSVGESDPIAPCDDGFKNLAPVGSYSANAWGLHDMHGNVWEWVYDRYDEDFYGREESKVTNPVNMMTGARVVRVLRGGSFSVWPGDTRSANRNRLPPSLQVRHGGLRVVRGRAPSMAP